MIHAAFHKVKLAQLFPKLALSVFLSVLAGAIFADQDNVTQWQQIRVPVGIYQVPGADGVTREIAPSCSGGPICKLDPVTQRPICRKGNREFSFFFKSGSEKQLLVYFEGGGACWDPNTCIASPQVSMAIYTAEIGPNVDPGKMGGLFDLANRKNPYKDWSMAYIPYCTGDIHWGSNDAQYTDSSGALPGTPGGQTTIHHRGFDNFLYVRHWLMQRSTGRPEKEKKFPQSVKQLLVAGPSAGGYGAAISYPYWKNAFPLARGYLFSDSGNGVVTDAFLQQAVQSPHSVWNAKSNFLAGLPGREALVDRPANEFLENYYAFLARYYPQDRFSQYTTQWDAIQAFFYNIMLNQNNIPLWRQVSADAYGEWRAELIDKTAVTSAASPNFRYYIAPGCNHTLLRSNEDFYNLRATQSNSFLSWFAALTEDHGNEGGKNWKNIPCVNCATPPTPAEIKVCMERSFAR